MCFRAGARSHSISSLFPMCWSNSMKLSSMQKVQAAFSAVQYRNELKQLLIRRYWQRQRKLEIKVAGVTALFDTSAGFVVQPSSMAWTPQPDCRALPSVRKFGIALLMKIIVKPDMPRSADVSAPLHRCFHWLVAPRSCKGVAITAGHIEGSPV